jgi:hypothetical protein
MPDFMDYERISDVLMYLSDNIYLEFITTFSKKNTRSGNRSFFTYETEYNSEKYGGSPVWAIHRNVTYYFVINVKENFGAGFILRPQDKELLSRFMELKVIPWILNDSVFQVVDGNLALKEFTPVTYTQSELKYITFEPCVMTDIDNKQTAGIKFNLNGNIVFEVNADKFMGFYSIIKTTDMYAVSCAQINYAKMPPHGLNQFKPVGLGAPKTPQANDVWSDNNYKGRGYNSFLDNIK